jgi:hypothetical protein
MSVGLIIKLSKSILSSYIKICTSTSQSSTFSLHILLSAHHNLIHSRSKQTRIQSEEQLMTHLSLQFVTLSYWNRSQSKCNSLDSSETRLVLAIFQAQNPEGCLEELQGTSFLMQTLKAASQNSWKWELGIMTWWIIVMWQGRRRVRRRLGIH